MKNFLDYIRLNPSLLKSRKHVIGMFTFQKDRPVYPDFPSSKGGIVFAKKPSSPETSTYGYYEDETFHLLKPSVNNPCAPFDSADPITVLPSDLANVKTKTETIIGRYVANYLLLVDPFGDLIPFWNDFWNIKKIEKIIGSLMLSGKITTEQYNYKYLENGYELGHFGELFVPTISEKSISTPKEILERRDELLAQNKDKLKDPLVITAIEKELISMYKKYIGDDPVAGYLEASEKSYNDHAKSMNIMLGAMPSFGGSSDDITVVTKSLNEGWDKEQFAALANVIRRGSYSRGVETQEGGTLTKNIFRTFQDVRLIPGDCKSKVTVDIVFDNVVKPEDFVGRTIVVNDTNKLITNENASSYAGKKVSLRSPLTCKHKEGICTTCMGKTFENMGISTPGPLAIVHTSAMMGAAMSAMHVDSIKTVDVDIEQVIV